MDSDLVAAGFVSRSEAVQAAVSAITSDDRSGLVFAGGAGVGKSFVLDRTAESLGQHGYEVVRLTGDPALAQIPFGAFRPILTVSQAPNWVEQVRAAISALTAPAGSLPTVVLIDELQHLDSGSASVLQQGLAGGHFRLVGSLRSEQGVATAIARLWADGLVQRRDLRPLDRRECGALACALVGGRLEGASEQRLWAWSQGNPLFLRELIESARMSGALQQVRGLWRVKGDVAGSDGLRSLLGHKLAGSASGVREVAELLAVADRLPASLLEAMAGPDAVAEAEQAGVIQVRDDAGLECRLAHPLHGEVLRHELGADRIRDRQSDLLDTVTALGAEDAADPILLAIWHLETARHAPDTVAVLTSAARRAWVSNDSSLAAQLAFRAWELGADPETGLLVCEALLRLGDGLRMRAVAEEILATASSDGVRGSAVAYLATGLRIWENQPDEAISLAQRYAAEIQDPRERRTLDLLVASVHLDSGRPALSATIARQVLEAEDPTTDSQAAMLLVPALATMGDLTGALEVSDRAIAAAFGAEGQLLNDLGAHLLFRLEAASMQGGLTEAMAMLEPSYEQVAASGDALALAWLTFVMGRVECRRGRAESGLAWFSEASTAFADLHRPAWEAWAQGGAAQCLAYLGRASAAREVVARVESLGRWRIPCGDPDVQRALAWVSVVEGDIPSALDQLRLARDQATAQDERCNLGMILNDMVRLGDLRVAADLRALADEVPSGLIAAWAARAAALVAANPDALAEVAQSLAAEGAVLEAAEVEAEVAALARAAGDERLAAAATARSARLSAECEGARNPASNTIASEPLSPRERDVARLAAAGESRRDIAGQLFLSVRTVDSHLQRIYRKLGVTSSAGLAQIQITEAD